MNALLVRQFAKTKPQISPPGMKAGPQIDPGMKAGPQVDPGMKAKARRAG
jgi:hypothetical protein